MEENEIKVNAVAATYNGKELEVKDRATAVLGKTKVKEKTKTDNERREKEQDGLIV